MTNVLLIGHLEALDKQLIDYLRADGIEVFSTVDTQVGIASGVSREPDLAFVEVDSPSNDNFEAIVQLRDECPPSCRIVAVCNRYSPQIDELCTEMGADFTIPQTTDRSSMELFIRGLLWLDPDFRRKRVNAERRGGEQSSGADALVKHVIALA